MLEYTGGAGDDFYIELTDAIRAGEAGTALADIDSMVRIGKDAKQLLADWLLHYRNLMICKYVQDPSELVNASSENTARIITQAKSLSDEAINYGIRLLSDTVNKAKFSTMPRILLETCVIKLIVGESAEVKTEPVRINANIAMGARTPRTEAGTAPAMSSAQQVNTKAENHRLESRRVEASQSGTPNEEPQAKNAYEKQAQSRPNASAERAQDVEEPQPLFEQKFNPLEGAPPDRHIVEFEANQNLDEMWDRICDQMARTDAMFMAMVAKYTRLVDLHGNELTVEVKKTKSLMADDALDELNRITKSLYGDKFYITLRVVEYNPADARALSQADEPSLPRFDDELIEEAEEKDERVEEVARDVADFFGVDKIDIK